MLNIFRGARKGGSRTRPRNYHLHTPLAVPCRPVAVLATTQDLDLGH